MSKTPNSEENESAKISPNIFEEKPRDKKQVSKTTTPLSSGAHDKSVDEFSSKKEEATTQVEQQYARPEGIHPSTIVHAADDGTVHIMEFPSDEEEDKMTDTTDVETFESKQTEEATASLSAEFENGENDDDSTHNNKSPERTKKRDSEASRVTQPFPNAEMHHNTDGTITIVEFPDKVKDVSLESPAPAHGFRVKAAG